MWGRARRQQRVRLGVVALDVLFEMADVGVDGVNMHTYPGATYQPFTFTRSRRRWSAFVTPSTTAY